MRGEESEEPLAAAGGPQQQRRLTGKFAEVAGEDMSRLAALCREAGLEQLFLTALKLG